MNIKTRIIDIMIFLHDLKTPITIAEISKKFNVSKRTIRYDLEEIKILSKKYDFALISKQGVGIYIKNKNSLNKFIKNFDDKNLSIEKTDRVFLILFKLFQTFEPIKINDLEEITKVSKSTISNDLDVVEYWLRNKKINLIRKQNFGILIDGEENDIRHAFTSLIYETGKNEKIIKLLNNLNKDYIKEKFFKNDTLNFFNELINGIDIFEVEYIIKKYIKKYKFDISFDDYASLIIHLCFSIKRIKNGKIIKYENSMINDLITKKELEIINKISDDSENFFEISIPQEERFFLAFHLLGAKKDIIPLNKDGVNEDFLFLAKEMCKIVDDYFKINLIHDNELIKGLAIHLMAAANRIKFNLPLHNPLLPEIKNKYSEIYEASIIASKIFMAYLNKNVEENEIGYIALHFGASIEKNYKNEGNFLKVILVCSSGIGTTNILKSRLLNEFNNIKIINTVPVREINKYYKQDIDLILSTFDIHENNFPNLKVSPLLSNEDISKIRSIIMKRKNMLNIRKKNISFNEKISKNDLLKILKNNIDDENTYIKIKNIIKEENYNKTNNYELTLKNLLNIKLIKKINTIKNWEDAVFKSGELLLKEEFIVKEYIQTCIKIIKENGPYSVISKHVALIHASSKDGVLKPGISMLIIKNGVKFNSKNDPVKIVFTFCAKDKNEDLKAITDILKLLNDKNFINYMISFKNTNEILKYIQNYDYTKN